MEDDRVAIEGLIQALVAGIRAKDIDAVMSVFAADVVSFDLGPPLQHGGGEAFRKRWQALFDAYPGSIDYELRDLEVILGGDVAFSHSLNKIGEPAGRWLRWTACYRRIAGRWLIVHEHVSVPADLRSGQAVLDLEP